jgi:hypothetical protein
MALLKKEDILRGLRKLHDQAKAAGMVVDIAIYGGATLAVAFDIRYATRDVDAAIHRDAVFLRDAAAEIATEEGWPENWLNDGVKGFASANEKMALLADFCDAQTGGLRIYTPVAEYFFAMKCMTMRPQGIDGLHDMPDFEALADEINVSDAEAALSLVEAFYPASRIPPQVRFGVEKIMEQVVARRLEKNIALAESDLVSANAMLAPTLDR